MEIVSRIQRLFLGQEPAANHQPPTNNLDATRIKLHDPSDAFKNNDFWVPFIWIGVIIIHNVGELLVCCTVIQVQLLINSCSCFYNYLKYKLFPV